MKAVFKKVAISTALKAGHYINKNIGKIRALRYKSEINIVTDIDRKAESIIVNAIKDKFPSHSLIAEEKKYKRQDSDKKASEFNWVIDPLDGTTNFLHGLPIFCVSIGLEFKGEIILGVIYDPTRDELFHAERGKGTFLNKKRIKVSMTNRLEKALLATGFAYNVKRTSNNNINNFTKFIKKARAVRRMGSAAIDMCYVACGRFDGFWELNLHPWDTAGASLIVGEAGGRVTRFDGSEYSIYDKEILTSNSKIHSQMIRVLSG